MTTEDNPFSPSQVPESHFAGGGGGLQYSRAYGFITDSTNWTMNLVFGSLCFLSLMIVPVVGQLIWIGYTFVIVEALHRRVGRAYPDFNFDDIADYLLRGLWIFLAQFVVMIILVPVLVVAFGLVFGVLAAVGSGGGDPGIAVFVVFGLMMLGAVAFWVLALLVMMPVAIRAGLSQSFTEALNLQFVKDFISRVWLEALLASLFLMVTALPICLAGMLLLCVGYLPAVAWVMMAQGHFYWQLYELYLQRGGTPIPLKEPQPPQESDPPC